MWDLIVSVPAHSLSFYFGHLFSYKVKGAFFREWGIYWNKYDRQ